MKKMCCDAEWWVTGLLGCDKSCGQGRPSCWWWALGVGACIWWVTVLKANCSSAVLACWKEKTCSWWRLFHCVLQLAAISCWATSTELKTSPVLSWGHTMSLPLVYLWAPQWDTVGQIHFPCRQWSHTRCIHEAAWMYLDSKRLPSISHILSVSLSLVFFPLLIWGSACTVNTTGKFLIDVQSWAFSYLHVLSSHLLIKAF